jgi:hypothetical protein
MHPMSCRNSSRNSPAVPVTESLERRTLMAATISGAVMRDVSGNGLSADDQPLAGVVVKLYRDRNANGLVDAADGAAVATKTSAAGTGAFSFGGLGTGAYLLQQTPGANMVRTAPALGDTIAVAVAKKNGAYANNVFADYVKDFDRSALTAVSYTINGTRTVSSLAGQVAEGDTVTANFTVAAGRSVTLSLVSYEAPAPTSNAENLQYQEVFRLATGTFAAGTHSLTVKAPNCYFQVDFVGGVAIDHFGPAGSNILYGVQGRLIGFANGGSAPCGCGEEDPGREGLTPGFWKNHTALWSGYATTQTLESVFDVPDSLGLDDKTLLEALSFRGGPGVKGAAQNLFRHAVAALLNAQHPLVDYPLAVNAIVTRVNSALAGNGAAAIESLKDELETYNQLGGGIDAHGNAV